MNYFFLYNFLFSITVFYLPLSRFSFSEESTINLSINFLIFVAITTMVYFRGRYALKVKDGSLYCYNFPFLSKFPCEEIKEMTLSNKNVRLKLKAKEVDIDYFFGIQHAIHTDVLQLNVATEFTKN